MDKAPLSLELVPMEEPKAATPDAALKPLEPLAAAEGKPALSAAPDPHSAEATLDAIEIVPFEKPLPNRAGVAVSRDPYAAQAQREYAQGHIDSPLWDRALHQAGGDATAAAAIYVRARGTALRLLDRDRRANDRVRPPPPAEGPKRLPLDPAIWQRYRYAIVIGVAVVSVAAVMAVLLVNRGGGAPAPVQASSPPKAAKAAAAAPAGAPAPGAQPTVAKPVGTELLKKIEDLRAAGNWNLVVLYSMEWTRQEPNNSGAWDQLRAGYLYLRQYEDARSAAIKATQVAPEDARLWRRLGEVDLELDDPEAALSAYEQAAARNSADVESLHQVALLNARLGRAPESKAAFDRAAAASPGDSVTACLRAGVAQMPPARDGYTMSRQIRAIEQRCNGHGDAVASTPAK
jgi:tetratricopeptide (TPR) repeat protein